MKVKAGMKYGQGFGSIKELMFNGFLLEKPTHLLSYF